MTSPAVFVDTWGWIALGRKREARHDEVVRVILTEDEQFLHVGMGFCLLPS